MRNKKARKNEQLFMYFVAFLHSINKNQVAFISALEEPRIPARFPKQKEEEEKYEKNHSFSDSLIDNGSYDRSDFSFRI